ncbi:ABC transporter permease [Petrotoga sp. 9PW.55.5.1]|uniref:carbohydrate ABC transporter permease n=1 Tax=Petrotoga sp. 9PW.55.5.1 TaxID=1308979 RepID=UPI000DC20461|nr:carbohydrate ABC transporter permease [Petrotoga sp. 9PW.55.5.1]RAO99589.1 ABC transporter permease [Petrotoga sp. 9PW.55.5.1]
MKKTFKNILNKIVIYLLLLIIGFAYLYPLFFMISTSFMDMDDLVNPTVQWIPTKLYLNNFKIASNVLNVGDSLINSIIMAGVPAILQTISSALIGYAFARFEFPLKKLWLGLLLFTFLLPVQVTLIPKYIMFSNYGMINTPLTSFLPALFGQGIRSTIFILIFYQFFSSYPKSIDEAAQIDGANHLTIFLRIAIPMSVPAIVVSILFSFVWYWNETYLSSLFFGNSIQTLPMRLQSFVDAYSRMYPVSDASLANRLNEGIRMAATLITIVPLILLYLLLQKQFVESVDRTGITGE